MLTYPCSPSTEILRNPRGPFWASMPSRTKRSLGEVLGHLEIHPKVEPKSYIAAAFKPKVRELAI